jgi:hypothetical protein
MDRTRKIIKYLEEYRHRCYIKLGAARYKDEEEYYRERYKDIGNLIKELEEHGCRRTIDA